jgi:hypothetical protein
MLDSRSSAAIGGAVGGTRIRIRSSVVLLVLVAAGCSWTMVGHDGGHSFASPLDRTITPQNVGSLHELWSGTGTGASAPVAADGRVFIVEGGTDDRELAAYAAPGCGSTRCRPTWTTPAAGTPLLAGGQVIAGTSSVGLIPNCPLPQFACYAVTFTGGAFDPATGVEAAGGANTAVQYPVVSDGVLYHWTPYATGLRPPSPPALWGLDETKLDGSGTTRRIDQFTEPVPYAVSDGSIYLFYGGTINGFVEGTPSGCGGFHGCGPTWTGTVAHPTPWDGLVTVANGLVYISDLAGGVEVFDARGCGGDGADPCAPLWTAAAGTVHVGQLAVTDTTLFAPSDDGHLYAFAAKGCGAVTCAPVWSADLVSAVHAPAVAGSLVYVGTEDGRLEVFEAQGCGTTSCAPVRSIVVGAAVRTPVAISDGRIFVADGAGVLHAFGV